MSVARETILNTLESMKQLEEFSVANLAEVSRYDLSAFSRKQQEKIRHLLQRLATDTLHHEDILDAIVARLRK